MHFRPQSFFRLIYPRTQISFLGGFLLREFHRPEFQSQFFQQYIRLFAERFIGFEDLNATYTHWDPAYIKKITHINIQSDTSDETLENRRKMLEGVNFLRPAQTTEIVKNFLISRIRKVLENHGQHSLDEIEEAIRICRENPSLLPQDALPLIAAFVYFGQSEIANETWDSNVSEARQRRPQRKNYFIIESSDSNSCERSCNYFSLVEVVKI